MKFSEYAYQRPDVDQLKVEFKALLEAFKNASSATEQSEILAKYYQLDDSASAMQNICYVRHSIDTTDKFYEEEVEFFNTRYPELSEVSTDFYKALLASPFRAELEAEYGKHLFVLADLTTKVFDSVRLPVSSSTSSMELVRSERWAISFILVKICAVPRRAITTARDPILRKRSLAPT